MNFVESYKLSTAMAYDAVKEKYGPYSIPFESDSEAHLFWLSAFDESMKQNLGENIPKEAWRTWERGYWYWDGKGFDLRPRNEFGFLLKRPEVRRYESIKLWISIAIFFSIPIWILLLGDWLGIISVPAK